MLIGIMGKSAVGKDTVQKELISAGIERVVSATTRLMREGEQDGMDYHFMTEKQFAEMQKAGGFIESVEFNGVHYGCPKASVDIRKDQCIVLEPHGMQAFLDIVGRENMFVVSLELSEEIRRKRANSRSPITDAEWKKRCRSDDERFPEDVVAGLANLRITLDDYMYAGMPPSKVADEILYAATVYAAHEKLPDEQYILRFEDVSEGGYDEPPLWEYVVRTPEEIEELKKQPKWEKDDDVPF